MRHALSAWGEGSSVARGVNRLWLMEGILLRVASVINPSIGYDFLVQNISRYRTGSGSDRVGNAPFNQQENKNLSLVDCRPLDPVAAAPGSVVEWQRRSRGPSFEFLRALRLER
jgi:hypothetical protein